MAPAFDLAGRLHQCAVLSPHAGQHRAPRNQEVYGVSAI